VSDASGAADGLPPVEAITIERTARVARLGPRGSGARGPLWICLHGYRQLAPYFLRHLRPLDDGVRRLVAPEALNRFYAGDPDGRHGADARVGATWMTRLERDAEIADYVRYLDRVVERELGPTGTAADGTGPAVLGFSQGAHTAARWALAGQTRPEVVVLWGEGLPHDVEEERLAASAVRWIVVRGAEDRSRDPAREARSASIAPGASGRSGRTPEVIESIPACSPRSPPTSDASAASGGESPRTRRRRALSPPRSRSRSRVRGRSPGAPSPSRDR